MTINLDRMLQGYVDCAEWADCGPDHETHGHDWADDVLAIMQHDCELFIAACGEPLLDALAELAPDYSDERFGHDFWLTRNGHGAGFWDREELDLAHARLTINGTSYTGTLGSTLTHFAKAMGQRDLYLGDDGLVYTL